MADMLRRAAGEEECRNMTLILAHGDYKAARDIITRAQADVRMLLVRADVRAEIEAEATRFRA